MTETHRNFQWTALLLCAALTAACSTPPPKPPKPKPLISEQGAQAPAGGTASSGTHGAPGGGGPGAPGSGQGYGAASANGAEVEEQEVAADGSTRVVGSHGHAAHQAPHAAGGGGGAALQPDGEAGAGAQPAGQRSAQGSGLRPPAHATGMVGIHIQERPASQGKLSDPNAAASRSGRADGRDGGSGDRDAAPAGTPADARLGVRGGRDERSTGSGTPPPSSLPPPPSATPVAAEDDILAQQLREAAEQEKDPALRDKLWAEYRKYKAGL